MSISGIGWITSRTRASAEMSAFVRDILGLESYWEEDDLILFRFPNGDTFEVTGPASPVYHDPPIEHDTPIAAFRVDDLDATRADLQAKGVEFLSDVHSVEGGNRWIYFRAPDGQLWELFEPAHEPQR
jgi:catechol 2,3-dioxygenase-like lactoylglutathione lyase family enzyme